MLGFVNKLPAPSVLTACGILSESPDELKTQSYETLQKPWGKLCDFHILKDQDKNPLSWKIKPSITTELKDITISIQFWIETI